MLYTTFTFLKMSNIFSKIQTILCNDFSFSSDQIQPEVQLELELGLDSRDMLELITKCEETFKVKIEFDDIDHFVSTGKSIRIKDIVIYLEKQSDFTL